MCTVTTPAPLFFSFFHLCCCTNVWSGVEQCLQESRISGTNLNQHMSALLTRWLYFKSACILVCVSAVVLCWATVYHLQVIKQRVTSCLFSKAWQWRQLDISAPHKSRTVMKRREVCSVHSDFDARPHFLMFTKHLRKSKYADWFIHWAGLTLWECPNFFFSRRPDLKSNSSLLLFCAHKILNYQWNSY